MLKKIFAMAAVASALMMSSAHAAAPVSWTGFYAGVNAGGAWGQSRTDTSLGGQWGIETATLRSQFSGITSGELSPTGAIAGGQVGGNYQFGSWVVGAEADFDFLGVKKVISTGTQPTSFAVTYNGARGIETNWVANFRPRLGYNFENNTLVYGLAGFSMSDVEGSWGVVSSGAYNKVGKKDDTLYGWTVGGGLEQAFGEHMSARLEYAYTDLGSFEYDSTYVPGSTFTTPAYNEHIKQDLSLHTIRAGLNYRF